MNALNSERISTYCGPKAFIWLTRVRVDKTLNNQSQRVHILGRLELVK